MQLQEKKNQQNPKGFSLNINVATFMLADDRGQKEINKQACSWHRVEDFLDFRVQQLFPGI